MNVLRATLVLAGVAGGTRVASADPAAPGTVAPTNVAPTTVAPTTAAPTSVAPTPAAPTTAAPTTVAPTSDAPTAAAPTTVAPTTVAPTPVAPTTVAPTTVAPTTVAPGTVAPTPVAPTTVAPTTVAPGGAVASRSAEPARAPGRWSGNRGGVFLGFSPLYRPQLVGSDRFNTGSLRSFDGGVELKRRGALTGSVGLRYSAGTIPSLEIYDPYAYTTTYVPNGSLMVVGIAVGFNIPLNEPYENLGPVQLFVPLAFTSDLVTVSGGTYDFRTVTFDSSIGFGARLYTKSFFRADLSALYHLGIPLGTFTGGSTGSPNAVLLDSAGETMKAGMSGFELRLGITFMLPGSPA